MENRNISLDEQAACVEIQVQSSKIQNKILPETLLYIYSNAIIHVGRSGHWLVISKGHDSVILQRYYGFYFSMFSFS